MTCSKGNSTWVMGALGCSTQGLQNSMAAKLSNRRLRSQVKTMLFVVFDSWVLLKVAVTKQQHLGDGGFGVERAGLVEQQGSKVVKQAAPVPGEGDGPLFVAPLQGNVPEGLRLMSLNFPAIAGYNENFLIIRFQTISLSSFFFAISLSEDCSVALSLGISSPPLQGNAAEGLRPMGLNPPAHAEQSVICECGRESVRCRWWSAACSLVAWGDRCSLQMGFEGTMLPALPLQGMLVGVSAGSGGVRDSQPSVCEGLCTGDWPGHLRQASPGRA